LPQPPGIVNAFKILLVIVSLSAAGCANAVYHYNLQHAYVARAAELSPEEADQVIRTVTKKSLRMIISVTRRPERNEVIVCTDNGEEGLMVYNLKKFDDGLWHIVQYGEGSSMPL
jgi:hypothetical protein